MSKEERQINGACERERETDREVNRERESNKEKETERGTESDLRRNGDVQCRPLALSEDAESFTCESASC